MEKPFKKVDIINEEEEGKVEIKKSKRFSSRQKRQDQVEDEVADFYQNKDFSNRPDSKQKFGGFFVLVLIWSIVFGLLAGSFSSYFILTRDVIDIPFIGEIKIEKNYSPQENNIITEKNVTVLAETRIEELVKDLPEKTARIFKKKSEESLPFLEQIYGPWQTIGLGIFLKDGWLAVNANFESETDYVAIDQENVIYEVEKIMTDSLTKISFVKLIGSGDFPETITNTREEIFSGKQAVLFDKFGNYHLTEINSTQKRAVFKNDDLIRSTDRFADYLILDAETSLGAFPQALIFGLDKKLIGLVSQGEITPFWQIENLFKQAIFGRDLARPLLGIDYLNINEAVGLKSEKFKGFPQGAIIYGSPLEDSPALEKDIKNADIIIKVDGVDLDKNQDLTYLVQKKNPGEEIELTIIRDNQEMVFRPILKEIKY